MTSVEPSGNPSSACAIRRLDPTDDPWQLRALRLEMLADTPIAFIERHEEAAARPASYWKDRLERYTGEPDRATFVAEYAGRWVGQAGGHLDHLPLAHLVSVYISPAHRGSGLLERLAGCVFHWARERGAREVRLEVAEINERAVAAYRRLGFVPTGRRQPHPLYPDRSDEIELARPLP